MGTPKGGKISVPFFLNQMAFLHVFLRAVSFFQSLLQFCFRCKSSILQVLSTWGYPKRSKLSFLFSVIKLHFFMHFNMPFHFFKVPFVFSADPKPAFCKAKVHKGTPKGGKISVPFFLNHMAFFHVFLRAISFFQTPFRFFPQFQNEHFARVNCIGVPPKQEKCQFLFS